MKVMMTISPATEQGSMEMELSVEDLVAFTKWCELWNNTNGEGKPHIEFTGEGYASPEEAALFMGELEPVFKTEKAEQYKPEITKIAQALGHPQAFLSDMARMVDLMTIDNGASMTREEQQDMLDSAMMDLGLSGRLTLDTLVVDAAALLRQGQYTN